MGLTIFIITVIFSCLFVGVFADLKNQSEEIRNLYKIDSTRYCNLQNETKKLRKEIEGRKKRMSKCTPVYLMCHYEPDEGSNIEPMPLTIDYKKIESDELNEKIADLIKGFEKGISGEGERK